MKVPLSNIPDEGLRESLNLPMVALKRVGELLGEQPGNFSAKIALRLRGGNVEMTGTMHAVLKVPCQRCADPVDFPMEEELAVTLAPERLINQSAEDHHLSSGELNVVFFPGDEIDLLQVLEDEILILLPDTICGEDGEGNCICCGRAVKELLGGETTDDEDHPFAQMKEFLKLEE